MNNFDDESDSEWDAIPPPQFLENFEDESVEEVCNAAAIAASIAVTYRVPRAKILNYVESVVSQYNDDDFLRHFRLGRDVVYDMLVPDFQISNMYISLFDHCAGREVISPEKHILLFLWFVGHQSASYMDIADRFNVTKSAMFNIITRVSDFLLSISNRIIRLPTQNEKMVTSNHFNAKYKYSGGIGAVDGCHIKIDRPKDDPNSYCNRKSYHSLHLQGLCNHASKFLDVYIGFPGAVHDARVFRNSPLFDCLPQLCAGGYHILGDSAYPLSEHIMVPYRDTGRLTLAQKCFNTVHSQSRVVIENAFGALKQRFRQLYYLKLKDVTRMVKIIHACCVLHNLANVEDLNIFEGAEAELYNVNDNNEVGIADMANARIVRDALCHQVYAAKQG